MSRWLAPVCALIVLLCPELARAQMGGRMGGGGGRMGRGGDSKPDKPRVVEQGKPEKKPKTKTRHRTWGDKKPMQFFQLNGYFRTRSDVFYRLNLGLSNLTGSNMPFLRPLQAYDTGSGGICAGSDRPDSCRKETILSSNMRLRLEPTLNVHSRVRVRMTVDIFDNLVLGSTPEGYRASSTASSGSTSVPISALSETQAVVQAGTNSWYDAILVKHVWGEVDLPFGRLSFGRMPDHWGLGLVANSGTCSGAKRWAVHHKGDPDRCTDSDFGDTVDRIQFATTIPMVNLLVGFAWDFQSTGLTTLNLNGDTVALNTGQPYDLTPADDLQQWTVFLGRIDTPQKVRQRLAAGEVVFNYGTRWVFQRQLLDVAYGAANTGLASDVAASLVRRKGFTMAPDIWLRLNWKQLHVEFEGVYKYGWLRHTEDLPTPASTADKDLTFQQFGWVLRGNYRLLNNKLRIGLELGMASGDDRLEGEDGNLHASTIPQFPADRTNKTHSLFHFDPNYRVDLIFFRELMGTVHNAGYVKPTIAYHILDNLTARLDMIYSYALEPVATPGNSPHYGVELDVDLEYRMPEAGFFAGIAYGVFFPLEALNRPTGIYGSGAGYPAKATNAHSVQLRATIKF